MSSSAATTGLIGGYTHLAEVGSTNDWLLERGADLPDGHWAIADRQTAGRGRRGRVWNDGAGNLMASVLVRAQGPVQQLSFVAALALREALVAFLPLEEGGDSRLLARRVGVSPCDLARTPPPGPRKGASLASPLEREERFRLKWPNDVLLDGLKVSGILLERSGEALVIGIGVNIASHPEGTDRPATSLAAAGLPALAPVDLLTALIAAFAHWRSVWAQHGFEPVRTAWLAHAAGVGDRIAARLGAETLEGRFEGLAPDGALALRMDDGSLRPVHAGEVFAL